MKFNKVEEDGNFPLIKYASDLWEIGIYPVLYGVRVGGNLIGEDSYRLNYCFGNQTKLAVLGLITVKVVLENIGYQDVKDVVKYFPQYKVRPIYYDDCFDKLLEKALKPEMIVSEESKIENMWLSLDGEEYILKKIEEINIWKV